MEKINALGFIEVYGLVAGIEAADAMVKSARVRLLRQYEIRPGMVTVVVEGDLGACCAAVDAGTAAAARVGTVIAHHVIPRADKDTEHLVLALIPPPDPASIVRAGTKTRAAKPAEHKPASVNAVPHPPKTPKTTASAPKEIKKTEKISASPLAEEELDQILAFIAAGQRGRNWNDITRQFPEKNKDLRNALEACVRSGKLNKVGARYRSPEKK